MKVFKFIVLVIWTSLLFLACDSGPRVIEAEAITPAAEVSENSIPIFKDLPNFSSTDDAPAIAEHEVVVEEILNTEKYSYLNVKEEDEQFWIAISKSDVKLGEIYIYKGGLLKKNFFSREFNRVFETVYLVSKIRKKHRHTKLAANKGGSIPHGESLPDLEVGIIQLAEGSVSLANIFSNKEKYSGQNIKITGKCVKVNPMIMNRNWLHIQDGSGEGLDLTVTTTENVPLGAIISMQGTITLDKDFGAGYRYDIIMEGAVLN